jgi:hypothetical protein
MEGERTVCVMCAWRGGCNKKFSMGSASTIRCPEYTRDLTLPDPDKEQEPCQKQNKAKD